MRSSHDLVANNAPTISLTADGEALFLHLPGDIAFGRGVVLPLNMEGLRNLHDLLHRHEALVTAGRVAQGEPKTLHRASMTREQAQTILNAWQRAGRNIAKLDPSPELRRIEADRKARERAANNAARFAEDLAEFEAEIELELSSLDIDL